MWVGASVRRCGGGVWVGASMRCEAVYGGGVGGLCEAVCGWGGFKCGFPNTKTFLHICIVCNVSLLLYADSRRISVSPSLSRHRAMRRNPSHQDSPPPSHLKAATKGLNRNVSTDTSNSSGNSSNHSSECTVQYHAQGASFIMYH